ncbi:Cell death activator CIDE-3 [Penaeus vannamei]|uniref:Cell death activator CIDE-3 n=1 Tax=Penaeus vannamei TaxID=6689 RepID=A0A3R7QMT7_PENVA|nr:Cell death activator CIDE-3 [Penaeus vannamei]
MPKSTKRPLPSPPLLPLPLLHLPSYHPLSHQHQLSPSPSLPYHPLSHHPVSPPPTIPLSHQLRLPPITSPSHPTSVPPHHPPLPPPLHLALPPSLHPSHHLHLPPPTPPPLSPTLHLPTPPPPPPPSPPPPPHLPPLPPPRPLLSPQDLKATVGPSFPQPGRPPFDNALSCTSQGKGKRPYKVWDSGRQVRKGLVVSSFNELIEKGREKLDLGEVRIKVVLEADGTQVEDPEYFCTLPENTVFLLLRQGEHWYPAGVEVLRQGSYALPRRSDASEPPNWLQTSTSDQILPSSPDAKWTQHFPSLTTSSLL